jgi:hypothetical protein
MDLSALTAWTLAAMLQFAPAERAPQFEDHRETIEETRARYAEIASTIAAECVSSSRTPKDCAAVLVAVGTGESHFARDADLGPCYRKGAYRSRCDGGWAASVWQVHAFGFKADGTPITVEDLFADRALAAKRAIGAIRQSIRTCRHLPERDRLSMLSGRCQEGLKSARDRYDLWQRVRVWNPPADRR